MRFRLKLHLQPDVLGNELPINYQYELSAAIYKVLGSADVAYSLWLHENGFETGGKRFKLFTFSRLVIPKYELFRERQRIVITSEYVYLYISFLPNRSTQTFIKGLFKDSIVRLGDQMSAVQFAVTDVDILPSPVLNREAVYETLSPVCVSERLSNGNMKYLSPTDRNYTTGILTGLLARYKAYYGKDYGGETYCDLKIHGHPKSVLVKIKSGTPQQTFVRGYLYRFTLNLPEELTAIAYESGLGEKGSLGFGMIKNIVI